MVGRLLSFWDGTFSGAMLNFQGVLITGVDLEPFTNFLGHPSRVEGSGAFGKMIILDSHLLITIRTFPIYNPYKWPYQWVTGVSSPYL